MSGTGAPVSVKHVILEESDAAAVTAAIHSADLSGTSAAVSQYEQALRSWFGVRHAVACSSGTAAIHLALLALGVTAGDEVVLPPTAPAMTALPVLALGANPVFSDTKSPVSFGLSLAALEKIRSSRTKAIISVPMWGYPADGPELTAACRAWGIPLIEDAAQAHGSRMDGCFLGTQGVVGAFSTHVRKLVCTGEGGYCLTHSDEIADKLRTYRNLGRRSDEGSFGTSFGLNYKLGGMPAALGTVQLGRLAARLRRRRATAARILGALRDVSGVCAFPVLPGALPNYYGLALHVPEGAAELDLALSESGILTDTKSYDYKPLYRSPVFAEYATAPCPNAEALCRSIVTVPCHEGITDDLAELISSTVASWAKSL